MHINLPAMTTPERIKTLIFVRKITAKQLAKEANISTGYLSEIINNKKPNFSIKVLLQFCEVLDVTPNVLLGFDDLGVII